MTPQMKKMLLIVGIVFGVIFGWYGAKKIFFMWAFSRYTPPPVTISATTANTQTWKSYLTAIGTLSAVNGVDISSEASGIVKEIRFNSGQNVTQGDVLILLDTRVEEAALKDNQAQLKLAQINYERDKTLIKKNVISQATLDTDFAKLQQTEANVESTKAKIQQKIITAPFSGRLGIRNINLGQYVSAGTAMVTLQSLDPLYVKFNLPEQFLSNIYMNQPIELNVNLGEGKSVNGTITAINSKVDQSTRNILVQANIPNKDMTLYPGMFALVKVWLKEQNNVVVIPETSIAYSLHGDSVFLIKKDEKSTPEKPILRVYRQYVKIGERRGDDVSILKGINTGDQVVTSGQIKLQNGTQVVIDNSADL